MQATIEPQNDLNKIRILQGEDAVKKDLKETLQSGWLLVTGDLMCIVGFENTYYSDPTEEGDFIYKVFVFERTRENRKYTARYIVGLAKKKKELEKLLGHGVERVVHVNFTRTDNKCITEVKRTSLLFPGRTIDKIVEDLFTFLSNTIDSIIQQAGSTEEKSPANGEQTRGQG